MKNFNSLLTVKRNSDPFGMGGGALNIFDQANQRQRQQNSPMPNGMEQNIPRNATAVPNNKQGGNTKLTTTTISTTTK